MSTEIKEVYERLLEFRHQREWEVFHSPKNLACSVAVEAGELLEIFQWDTAEPGSSPRTLDEEKLERIRDEIADVGIYLLMLAGDLKIDIIDAINSKITLNAERYPIESHRGVARKSQHDRR